MSSNPSAAPSATRASFQARLLASIIPVFRPWPPAGEWMCAASPANSTRPRRYVVVDLSWQRKHASHPGSETRRGHGARCATRSWISSKDGGSPRPVAGIGHHQPPPVPTHREADQRQSVRTEEGPRLVIAVDPVEGDIGQQPVMGVRLPLEPQTELVTHPAVRPVTADHVVGTDLALVARDVAEPGV